MLTSQSEFLIDRLNPERSVMEAIAGGLNPEADLSSEEQDEIQLARTHMRHYIPYTFPGYKADYLHLMVCDAVDRIVSGDLRFLMLFAPPQVGKALAVDTPIPTPNGWKRMGDVKVGDVVFSDIGRPCSVIATTGVFSNRPVHAVCTDDGDRILADDQHEWVVRLDRKRPVLTVRTTAYLAGRSSPRRPMVKIHGALDLPDIDLPIDPYVLGVWLGDGTSAHATITQGKNDIAWMRGEIERCGYRTADRSTNDTFGIYELTRRLSDLGLLNNKHIPTIYLRSGTEQRRALLQGLIDTDGHVDRRGTIEFSTTSRQLALGTQELIRSLGVKTNLRTRRARLYGKDCGESYRLVFFMESAARMSRKASHCKNGTKHPHHYIWIETAGRADTMCIQVDSPSGMFLCGLSMLPTHNSEIVSTRLPGFWLAHHPDKPVLLSSYGDEFAKRNSVFARTVVEGPAYQRLFGSWGIAPDPRRWQQKGWFLQGEKGGVRSAGVGGRVTGEGFFLGIVDDPTKDWAEAQSEVIREKQWSWWQGTLQSRFWENYAMVFMTTRWHEDGLEARVLKLDGNLNVCRDCGKYMPDDKKPERCPKCGGERGKWKTLSFSARCESQEERDATNASLGLPSGLPDLLGRKLGASVAPSRYSIKAFVEKEKAVGPIVWDASYQQHPTAPKGDVFKIGRIEVLPAYPTETFRGELQNYGEPGSPKLDLVPLGIKHCVRFWDLAATEPTDASDPDWTVGALVGIDKETGLTWVLNVVRVRGSPENVQEIIKGTSVLDGKGVKIRIEMEPGSAGKKLINDYIRVLAGYDVAGVAATGEKYVRAIPLSAQVNAGNVKILEASWNAPWMAILAAFPRGKHDDDVDATSGAFNEITEPSEFKPIKFKYLKSGRRR